MTQKTIHFYMSAAVFLCSFALPFSAAKAGFEWSKPAAQSQNQQQSQSQMQAQGQSQRSSENIAPVMPASPYPSPVVAIPLEPVAKTSVSSAPSPSVKNIVPTQSLPPLYKDIEQFKGDAPAVPNPIAAARASGTPTPTPIDQSLQSIEQKLQNAQNQIQQESTPLKASTMPVPIVKDPVAALQNESSLYNQSTQKSPASMRMNTLNAQNNPQPIIRQAQPSAIKQENFDVTSRTLSDAQNTNADKESIFGRFFGGIKKGFGKTKNFVVAPFVSTDTPVIVKNNPAPVQPVYKGRINPYPLKSSDVQGVNVTGLNAMPAVAPIGVQIEPLNSGASISAQGTNIAPVSDIVYETVNGFGSDIPLVIALSQIIPPSYPWAFEKGINLKHNVSWKGGQAWPTLLKQMLEPLDLSVNIVGKTVQITRLYTDSVTLNAPVRDVSNIQVQSQEIVKIPVVASEKESLPQGKWKAMNGELLKEVLNQWSAEEGLVFYWDSKKQVVIDTNQAYNGSLKDAITAILSRPEHQGFEYQFHKMDPKATKPALLVIKDKI